MILTQLALLGLLFGVWDPLNTKPRNNNKTKTQQDLEVDGCGKVKNTEIHSSVQISGLLEWWSHFPNQEKGSMCVLGGGEHSDFFQGHAEFEVLCDQQAVGYMLLELRSKIWVDGTDVNIIKQEKVQIIIGHSGRKKTRVKDRILWVH